MPEALQQPPNEADRQQKIDHTLDVVNTSLNIAEIPLGPKARLVPSSTEGLHTVEDIKSYTPIKPQQPDQFPETSLPDFLKAHVDEIAKLVMGEEQYQTVVPGGTPNAEKRLELLKHFIELAQDQSTGLLSGKLDSALSTLGVQRLPRRANGTEQDTTSAVFTVAALQAALVDHAKELVNEFTKQSAPQAQAIETTFTAAPHANRGEIYGVVRNNMNESSVELSGRMGATVDRNITFKVGDSSINIPTSHVLQILRESLDPQSAEVQTAKQYGEKLAVLIGQSFGDIPQVQSFVEAYKRYLEGKANQDDMSLLLEQVKHGAFRVKEGNFLREAFNKHRESFDDTPIIDSAVREDLLAAQQLVNSMIPPEFHKDLAILDYKIKQAREAGNDGLRDQLIQEQIKMRQTMYKAIMYAYNVQPDNKNMYDQNEGVISFTDEERKLGEMVKKRRQEVVTYESFSGEQKKTTRSSMNAVDAASIATEDLIEAFGIRYKTDLEEISAARQAVSPKALAEFTQALEEYNRLDLHGVEERNRPPKPKLEKYLRKHFTSVIINLLDIAPDDPNLPIINDILNNRVQTLVRLNDVQTLIDSQEAEVLKQLVGKEPRFQRLTGDLPEHLALTRLREMGLKGVEFLYRRSLSEPTEKPKEEIPPEPVPQAPAVEELEKKGIPLMEIHEDTETIGLLGALDKMDAKLSDLTPQGNVVGQDTKPDDGSATLKVTEDEILDRLEKGAGAQSGISRKPQIVDNDAKQNTPEKRNVSGPEETVRQLQEDERKRDQARRRILKRLKPPGTAALSILEEAEDIEITGPPQQTGSELKIPQKIQTNKNANKLIRFRDYGPATEAASGINGQNKTPVKTVPTQRIDQSGEFSDYDDFASAEFTGHSGFSDIMDHPATSADQPTSTDTPVTPNQIETAETAIPIPEKRKKEPSYDDALENLVEIRNKVKTSYANNNLEAAKSKRAAYAREQSTAFSAWFSTDQENINPGIQALARFMNNYFAGRIIRHGNSADIEPLNETAEKFYEVFGINPNEVTEKELYPVFKGLFLNQYHHRAPFNQMQAVHLLDLIHSCSQFISRDPVSREDPIYPLVLYLYKDYKKVLQEIMDCRIIDFGTPPVSTNQAVTYPGIHYNDDNIGSADPISVLNYLGNALNKEMRKKRWSPR